MTCGLRKGIVWGGAIGINVLLFVLLAGSVRQPVNPHDLEELQPVRLVEFKPASPEQEEKKPEPEPPDPEEFQPPDPPDTPQPVVPQMQMNIPDMRLDFAVDPKIAMGAPVAAPPVARPVVSAPSKDVFGMDEVDTVPSIVRQTRPKYPHRARRMQLKGTVGIRFLVNTDGSVGDIIIISSDPKGVFDGSVRKAVSSWKFTPGKKDGRLVRTWFVTSIKFQLES